jgi:hypothetical protein
VAAFVLADAHAFRIVAIGAKRRCAGGADPFRAALVTALLLGEALAQQFEQFIEPAHGLDLFLFVLGEIFLGELFEPPGRNLGLRPVAQQFEALEYMAEHAVKLVDPSRGEIGLHRLHQRQILAQRNRHARRFEIVKERDEHRLRICSSPAAVKPLKRFPRTKKRTRPGDSQCCVATAPCGRLPSYCRSPC